MRAETQAISETLLARYGLPPAEIERLSLARIEALAGPRLPIDSSLRYLARRILYAAGDPELAESLRFHSELALAAVQALRNGCPVIVDVSMVAAGLRKDALARLACPLIVAVAQAEAAAAARVAGTTRSAMGMRLLADRLAAAIVVVGNAPTALLELLDLVDAGAARPAAIIGMPVGMVAAAESKAELVHRTTPYATVLGTRGGSALAAAALNGLLELACGGHPNG